MTDEELISQATMLVPVYIDGLGAFRKINGALRCVGYVADTGAVLNLVVSLSGADATNREVRRILDGGPPRFIQMKGSDETAH